MNDPKKPIWCVLTQHAFTLIVLATTGSVSAQSSGVAAEATAVHAKHNIIPIMLRRCTMCHGLDYREARLDLRNRTAILKGGRSGPAVSPGKPDESLVLKRIDESLCPPTADISRAGIEPITELEKERLRDWIAQGALPYGDDHVDNSFDITNGDRGFWSFRKPQRPNIPDVEHLENILNPIDNFVLSKLESRGMGFSAIADRYTLFRRVTFDLTGLPPAPDDVIEFVNDRRPDSYERMIDRILASQEYGERWARFWLDLAGYSDSEGKRNADTVRPNAYRYRDYVIRAFNSDMPYDQFLTEQIAGDEIVDYEPGSPSDQATIDKLVATGFLRMAPDGTSANPVNRLADRMEVIADEIDILTRGVMGLTLKCAQCHSHKYDPISHADYYRFLAIFKGAYDEYNWLVPQPFGNQWTKAKQRSLDLLTVEERDQETRRQEQLKNEISKIQTQIADKSTDKKILSQLKNRKKSLDQQITEKPKVRALWDRGEPSPTYVYHRGDVTQPGALVQPGPPTVLTTAQMPYHVVEPTHSRPKSGRRLALVRWLTQPDHPLTARVIVNRIWQHHFGTGIVESVDNFGKLGTPPSHPALLDWLSVEFVENGWSIKQLHRMIMTSRTYRQSSGLSLKAKEHDPDGRLLSRMPMRRMQAEQVRDSLIALAGRLDRKQFGKPDPVTVRKDGLVTVTTLNGTWRRSVYVRHRRKEIPTILESFDLPQMNPNCVGRLDSTVVTQSLHLMNNKLVHELAGHFAERVRRDAGPDHGDQITRAYLTALGRPPSRHELTVSQDAILGMTTLWQDAGENNPEALAIRDLCHVLMNSAGFLYID